MGDRGGVDSCKFNIFEASMQLLVDGNELSNLMANGVQINFKPNKRVAIQHCTTPSQGQCQQPDFFILFYFYFLNSLLTHQKKEKSCQVAHSRIFGKPNLCQTLFTIYCTVQQVLCHLFRLWVYFLFFFYKRIVYVVFFFNVFM